MNSKNLILAVLVTTTLLLGPPGDSYAQSTPRASFQASRFEPAPCPFVLDPGQVDGRTVTCGFVTVPEDRQSSAHSSVRLAVAVFKALRPGSPLSRSVPVLFIGGGPGSAVLDVFGTIATESFGHDVNATRDLILFDQRGVGFSQPSLACPELTELKYQQLGQHISRVEEDNSTVQASLRCRDRLRGAGINLAAYTTAASAADVDAIRRALGYAQVDLWGLSYGTRLALAVMDAYPKTVRAAVLDSALPPQVRQLVQIPGNIERAFRVFFDGCARDPACAGAYPDLEATFYQLVAELNASPRSYQAQDPHTGAVHIIVLTGDGLVRSLFAALHHTDMIPFLPLTAASLRQGDTSLLSLAADRLVFADTLSQGVNYSVQCAEEANLTNPAAVAAAAHRVRPEIGDLFTKEAFFRACNAWGAARVSPSIKNPTVSAIPALILAGEYDPATSPTFGRIAGRTLRNSFFFEFPGIGHYVDGGSPCAHAIMLQFLKNPNRRPDAGCIAQMKPPLWVIPPAPAS